MARYIYNFKIAKNLYDDLQSQATLNHRKLKEEIYSRLERTCIESYGYNYSSDLSDKIRKNAYRLYIDPDSITTITFDFNISKRMNEIISKIQSPNMNHLNQEIINRLAYTLIDPFYNQFNKD